LRWPASLSLARAERASGQNESALGSYFWAIRHFWGIWWGFYKDTETSAVAFTEDAQAAYREYIDLSVEQWQLKRAYELADEAKARVTLNLTTVRRGRPSSRDSKQAATQRRQAKRQKNIEDEHKTQEARLHAEMTHSKERLVWSPLAEADKLQEQMARDQMTLVQFALGENRSFVWLFTQGEVYFEILPPRKQIEKEVKQYLDVLGATPNHFYIKRDLAKLKEQSQKLFTTLLGPLSSRIEPGQRLIVVPDGLLHYLPFETLIHKGRYFVEDHEISYSPSASLLVQPQDSKHKAETEDRMELLAFGDPIFGREQKEPATRKPGARPVDVTRRARPSRGFKLPRLPRTRDEVQYITRLFPPDRTQLYLGKASSEGAVKRESLRRYRRLHFATHSLIDETSPSRSAVVLTLDNDEDGFLEVSEISELDLDCDLVVLSACQTGRGQLLSGEGIIGLSRAFLHAGARTLVVSHWNVSDGSTARLMESFYRHLTTGHSNAAALRQSKLQMLNGGEYTRHPYYWAPFVMVGRP
jgi:CHAT domain-containing protein